jgi:hypothetical protein
MTSISDSILAMQEFDIKETEFAGWALLDLADPIANRAYQISRKLGIPVEEFIQQALAEKLERMGERQDGIA